MEVSTFLSQTVRADCFMVSHYVSFCSMAEGCASSSRVTGSGGWTTMGSARSKAESPLSSPREKAFAGVAKIPPRKFAISGGLWKVQ
jgi:hypothetical protein